MTWFRRKPDEREERAIAANLEADQSLAQAENQLLDASKEHARAVTLTQKLHQIRERNHFGESLEGLYREKKA